jgi:membrane protease YdiL (CAAX protease family)
MKGIFIGPSGIRSGWRLVLFAAIAAIATLIADRVKIAVIHALPHRPEGSLDPFRLIIRELGDFSTLIIAGLMMAWIEGRRIGDYGLTLRRGFRQTFWEGALYGFAGVSLILWINSLAGYMSFTASPLDVGELVHYAALYAVAFLTVALMEEYSFRGYCLYTLATGIGFWPATLVIAALFAYAHAGNQGESVLGVANLAVFFVVFCFVLRRTGDLWMAIGFHMTWNWGEAFFYGLPDSGIRADTHLLSPGVHGPDLWTGGTAGPEASLMDPIVLLLIAVVIHFRYRLVIYHPGEVSHSATPAQGAG